MGGVIVGGVGSHISDVSRAARIPRRRSRTVIPGGGSGASSAILSIGKDFSLVFIGDSVPRSVGGGLQILPCGGVHPGTIDIINIKGAMFLRIIRGRIVGRTNIEDVVISLGGAGTTNAFTVNSFCGTGKKTKVCIQGQRRMTFGNAMIFAVLDVAQTADASNGPFKHSFDQTWAQLLFRIQDHIIVAVNGFSVP